MPVELFVGIGSKAVLVNFILVTKILYMFWVAQLIFIKGIRKVQHKQLSNREEPSLIGPLERKITMVLTESMT